MPDDNQRKETQFKMLYTFRIEPSLLKALQDITERDGVPVSEQIRRGIRMWLDSRISPTTGKRTTNQKK